MRRLASDSAEAAVEAGGRDFCDTAEAADDEEDDEEEAEDRAFSGRGRSPSK